MGRGPRITPLPPPSTGIVDLDDTPSHGLVAPVDPVCHPSSSAGRSPPSSGADEAPGSTPRRDEPQPPRCPQRGPYGTSKSPQASADAVGGEPAPTPRSRERRGRKRSERPATGAKGRSARPKIPRVDLRTRAEGACRLPRQTAPGGRPFGLQAPLAPPRAGREACASRPGFAFRLQAKMKLPFTPPTKEVTEDTPWSTAISSISLAVMKLSDTTAFATPR